MCLCSLFVAGGVLAGEQPGMRLRAWQLTLLGLSTRRAFSGRSAAPRVAQQGSASSGAQDGPPQDGVDSVKALKLADKLLSQRQGVRTLCCSQCAYTTEYMPNGRIVCAEERCGEAGSSKGRARVARARAASDARRARFSRQGSRFSTRSVAERAREERGRRVDSRAVPSARARA